MWELIVGELTHAMHELARDFAHFLPRLLAMLVIAVLGWAMAYLLKVIVRAALRLVKFEKLSESAGANQLRPTRSGLTWNQRQSWLGARSESR